MKKLLLIFMLIPISYFASAQDSLMTLDDPVDPAKLALEVKEAAQHAWNGYRQFAWGMDALRPLTKSGHNWYRESLLMTPVDAYDLFRIMKLDKEASEAKDLILSKLNFDLDMEVQNFEVSIRILGGLLSAYELDNDPKFLELAKDLADRLIRAFGSPTGMPYRYVNLKTGKTRGEVSNPAEIGTYIIEYGILSRYTGDPRYYETAKRAMTVLHSKRSKLDLPGSSINIETGEWVSTDSHISGGIDSYFEYMLKAGVLFDDRELKEMWNTSLQSIQLHLADKRFQGLWYGRADMNDGKLSRTTYGSLDAFFAGSLAMAGEMDPAVALQESNYRMWMIHGIEPEGLNYANMEVAWPSYELRPENLESAYYLYTLTGDDRYRKMGERMFHNLVQYCRNETGFCALESVISKQKKDEMESFFLAETLKYAFLLFDNTNSLNFKEVIFNTEAHPYKR